MLCIATPQALEMRLVRSIERQDKATLIALLTGVSWLDTTVANGMFVQFELEPVADVAELVSLQQAVTSSGLETHVRDLQPFQSYRTARWQVGDELVERPTHAVAHEGLGAAILQTERGFALVPQTGIQLLFARS